MFRNYNEDWQRRKAVLIRSLFYDVPLLSPVTEESNEDSDIIQPGENDMPSTQFVPRSRSRSESPLPLLIIEKVSNRNRHDESEEYYQQLLPKIKRLYRKLFIENQDLSSEDYYLIHTSNDDIIESCCSNPDDINLDLTENHQQDNSNSDPINGDVRDDSESIHSNEYEAVQAIEEDVSSDDTDYKQITTEAIIHFDGTQDSSERESRVYEDSIKSIILPTNQFRKANELRNVDVENTSEEYVGLEDNEDPTSTTSYDTDHSIEMMRTHQTKYSQESMPIKRCSDSETSTVYTAAPQELTDLTSSVDDAGNDMSEHKTTDKNNILDSNESGNVDYNTPNSEPSGRKRKLYEDVSVQTSERERVTWDDLRGNFFVGTPKIFRLCSCVDHICD